MGNVGRSGDALCRERCPHWDLCHSAPCIFSETAWSWHHGQPDAPLFFNRTVFVSQGRNAHD